MNVVGYGGGTDSTAMLIGLWRHHVPVDLILFADPGAEQPHTYAYLDTMSRWLENHGMPAITRVWYTEKNGQRLTLEQECLRSGTLPSIAYGYKKCSLKHKVAPQEKFCRHYQPCIDAWEKGEKVVKFIGYDAGEERRLLNALPHDLQDKKYQKEYPLMEWGWSRKDCIQAIRDAGLPLPGKSSCFFCPSMKRWEIRTLYHRYPDGIVKKTAHPTNSLRQPAPDFAPTVRACAAEEGFPHWLYCVGGGYSRSRSIGRSFAEPAPAA